MIIAWKGAGLAIAVSFLNFPQSEFCSEAFITSCHTWRLPGPQALSSQASSSPYQQVKSVTQINISQPYPKPQSLQAQVSTGVSPRPSHSNSQYTIPFLPCVGVMRASLEVPDRSNRSLIHMLCSRTPDVHQEMGFERENFGTYSPALGEDATAGVSPLDISLLYGIGLLSKPTSMRPHMRANLLTIRKFILLRVFYLIHKHQFRWS
jgi:hypothetical protein